MGFSFYPRHEHNFPNVSHCPHFDGASLGTLLLLAKELELSRRSLRASIDAERALRPLVVYRKITFRHRRDVGAMRIARLMTVAETAKRHG